MQSYSTRPVETSLDLRLIVPGHSSLHVPAVLSYDPVDPYAITMELSTGPDHDVVEWVFARSLLLEGVSRPSGEGDVHVWPVVNGPSSLVFLSLSSPSGSALFEIDLHGLEKFLRRTTVLVPEGQESEHVNLDAELALILA